MPRSLAEAVVIKDEDVFLITNRDGSVPLVGRHGFGLYYHDCRFLNGYEITLDGQRPESLVASALGGFSAMLELTNPDLRIASRQTPRRAKKGLTGNPDRGRSKQQVIPKRTVGIRWERVIAFDQLALEERLTFTNYGSVPVELPVGLTFSSGFEDIFTVRGFHRQRRSKPKSSLFDARAQAPGSPLGPVSTCGGEPGTLAGPSWRDHVLHFVYAGADGIYRSLHVHFSRQPWRRGGGRAEFLLDLDAKESVDLLVSLTIAESRDAGAACRETHAPAELAEVRTALQQKSDEWVRQHTEVRSSSRTLNLLIERSLRDLRMLHNNLEHQEYFAAGIPWYAALFGRDSIITAMETLAYDPSLAEQTLRLLAAHQGRREDEWRDEEPGKILHELRTGELAHLNEIPHTPYYGSVDVTPLFLVLVGQHARWTGNLALFRELQGNIELALRWIDQFGDLNRDGYVKYRSKSRKGLVNQGWKDSGDAIMNADGSLARPPIALVEVQGYVYWAKKEMAELFRRTGQIQVADGLERAADGLRQRFNRDFWLRHKSFYALALDANGGPAEVISSNPGHALWAGIADADKARSTAERLMGPDMFTGWGIRTLSSEEARFNPIGYHVGTVWPHDTAIIAAGFRRYGFDQFARRLFTCILEASLQFTDHRLPEAFAGLSREEYGIPVRYPVACHPQAWAAGSAPFLLETALGLHPDAFASRLTIVHPILPEMVQWVELRQLRVGQGSADLHFEQTVEGHAVVEVLKSNHLEVFVEADGEEQNRSARSKGRKIA